MSFLPKPWATTRSDGSSSNTAAASRSCSPKPRVGSRSAGSCTNTAAASEVFIIRQNQSKDNPIIFYANLKTPSGFFEAGNFYLINNDIVYVNSSSTTRWNKVISQFFPFSTLLNSIDNLTTD